MPRIKWLLTVMLVAWTALVHGKTAEAKTAEDNSVVIVSSYNPDVKSINENVAAFYEECTRRKLPNTVALEDIHAQNLPDCFNWKHRMWGVLKKYYENGKKPAVIVLLGNEANAAFFSLDRPELKATPVVTGMGSATLIKLPDNDTIDLKQWNPKAYDITKDLKDYNIVGGRLYRYDIKKNLELIRYFYPKRDTLVFISDNTLGGLAMRATFAAQAEGNTKFHIKYIDGRAFTFLDINDYLANLGDGSLLLVGTWRIDSSNRFLVRNTTYTLGANNPQLPAFTLSDVGMGHWTVGGYSPKYHTMGKYLADDVADFLKTGSKKMPTIVPNKYIFDHDRLEMLGLSLNGFMQEYKMVNEPVSPLEEYKMTILGVLGLIVILTCSLLTSLTFLKKSKKLQKELIVHGKELEQMKETAEEAMLAAEEANMMKSRFIADMSHEIRTPLNAVIGFAQVLTSTEIETSDAEKAEFGKLIMLNSELLLKLVNDILDISKIDTGRLQLEIKKVDIVQLCNQAAVSASAIPKPGVEIRTETNLDSLLIDTDKNRLLQVMSNLLNNAKKCTEKGSITIRLELSDEEDAVIVSVTDTGCGIPKEKAEAVFERFKKLDAFKQGTGLGLAISRSIIEQLDGRIWVDTTYTGGARFIFSHPIHTPEAK